MANRIVRGTDPRVQASMANNHGLITPERARDLGMGTPYIRTMLKTRDWMPLRRGVYVETDHWNSLDPWHEQPLLRARAAVIAMRRAWVLSHDSAAHALGLDVLVVPGAPPPLAYITRPGDTTAWAANGVSHHLARFAPSDVLVVDDLEVLDHARTAVDIARQHGLLPGLVTATSALRNGDTTKEAMWNVVDRMSSWPYVTTCRSMIELADPRAQTTIEVLGLDFVRELGIGEPDPQWPLQRSDGRIAWCDARVGCHVFEFHGKVKIVPVEQGGVADKPADDVLWSARRRERDLTSEGLGVSNLYWDDFFGARRKVALRRARAERDHTVERFGTVLPPHLERNALEIRARNERPDAS